MLLVFAFIFRMLVINSPYCLHEFTLLCFCMNVQVEKNWRVDQQCACVWFTCVILVNYLCMYSYTRMFPAWMNILYTWMLCKSLILVETLMLHNTFKQLKLCLYTKLMINTMNLVFDSFNLSLYFAGSIFLW